MEGSTVSGINNASASWPDVYVVMLTYKHAAFIGQAIQGVLMQEYEGKLTLLIADDASPDSTPERVAKLIEGNTSKHRIEYHRHPKNIGLEANFVWATLHATGKYIAFCEGDDYWTSPSKINQQVDYLERHPYSAGCFHHAQLVDESGMQLEPIYNEQYIGSNTKFNQEQAFTELASSYASCSLLFRQEVLNNPPKWYLTHACDEVLDLLITQRGSLDKIPGNMSAYRFHLGGMWSGASLVQRDLFIFQRALAFYEDKNLRNRFSSYLNQRIKGLGESLALKPEVSWLQRWICFCKAVYRLNFNRLGSYLFVLRFVLNPIFFLFLNSKKQ